MHWLQNFLLEFEGTLITISHDRHFLNSVCTHIADIDYETIITYSGGYDDMVLAKTQIRSRLESQNAQREKKIAQLNEFIARFSAGTRSSQVTSRKKEVERLQTTELARSNIQRPYIRFDILRPSGKHILEFEHLSKSYGDQRVIHDFSAAVMRGEKVCLMGRNGLGKTTLLKSLLVKMDQAEPGFTLDGGTVKWGHEAQIGYFPQDHTGSIEKGMTVADWLHQFDPQGDQGRYPRPAGADAVQRRRGIEEDRSPLRGRGRTPDLLPPDAAEAEHPHPRRADEPPRPGGHQCTQYRHPAL